MQTRRKFIQIILLTHCFHAQAQTGPVVMPYAPELFPPGISGGVCGFSPNGKTIYFVREDTFIKKLLLYQAEKNGKVWGAEQLLPFSGKHNDLGGRLSADGKKFYFTSDRPKGSSTESDVWNIWISAWTDTGWGDPVPFREINDKGMECCPVPLRNGGFLFSADRDKAHSWWISEWREKDKTETFIDALNKTKTWQWPSSFDKKGKILFLNSMKRPDSRGMDDVYVAFRKKRGWTQAVNIGAPVNSEAYEDGAILSPDEQWLIFCRHETAETPSQVLCVEWKMLFREIQLFHT
jgi:WD40-like Beta Propeller Repeat